MSRGSGAAVPEQYARQTYRQQRPEWANLQGMPRHARSKRTDGFELPDLRHQHPRAVRQVPSRGKESGDAVHRVGARDRQPLHGKHPWERTSEKRPHRDCDVQRLPSCTRCPPDLRPGVKRESRECTGHVWSMPSRDPGTVCAKHP